MAKGAVFNIDFATKKLLLGSESLERWVGVAKLRRGRGKPYLITFFFFLPTQIMMEICRTKRQ